MIDYDALKALDSVIENQSFQLASKELRISQSAVTQRIQNFESYIGKKLLIRTIPYRATKEGSQYLNLLRKVISLESSIINSDVSASVVRLAVNRDSLDTYFLKVLRLMKYSDRLNLQIIADDQGQTLRYLKNGQVDMCISSQEKKLSQHSVTYLGDMSYSLVCSKKFYQQFFSKGINKKSLEGAPLVIFDKDDKLQHNYLKENYAADNFDRISSFPSIMSFKEAIISGIGYGLLPLIDIQSELRKEQMILMNKKINYKVSLYLHHWDHMEEGTKLLKERIIKAAKALK
ncbi:MAG: hypothetical protein CME63_09795 [Halobacteriovoraceae bacterium]|nr:hypothetical protein [Halobacteriovoraceae bacterium]|tara:strand:+ start:24617 stop:25483 length:867 start_codon:yes stop_codon:yes gene_type:complete